MRYFSFTSRKRLPCECWSNPLKLWCPKGQAWCVFLFVSPEVPGTLVAHGRCLGSVNKKNSDFGGLLLSHFWASHSLLVVQKVASSFIVLVCFPGCWQTFQISMLVISRGLWLSGTYNRACVMSIGVSCPIVELELGPAMQETTSPSRVAAAQGSSCLRKISRIPRGHLHLWISQISLSLRPSQSVWSIPELTLKVAQKREEPNLFFF